MNRDKSIKSFFKRKFELDCDDKFIKIIRIKKNYIENHILSGVSTFVVIDDNYLFYSYTDKSFYKCNSEQNFNDIACEKNEFVYLNRFARLTEENKKGKSIFCSYGDYNTSGAILTKDFMVLIPKVARNVSSLYKVKNTILLTYGTNKNCLIIQKDKIFMIDYLLNTSPRAYLGKYYLEKNKEFFLINNKIYKLNSKGILCKIIKIVPEDKKIYYKNKLIKSNVFAKQNEILINFVIEKDNNLVFNFNRAKVNYNLIIEQENNLEYIIQSYAPSGHTDLNRDFRIIKTNEPEIKIVDIDKKCYLLNKKNKIISKIDNTDKKYQNYLNMDNTGTNLSLFSIYTNYSPEEEKLDYIWLDFKAKELINYRSKNKIVKINGGYYNDGYIIYYDEINSKFRADLYDKDKKFIIDLFGYLKMENKKEQNNEDINNLIIHNNYYREDCSGILNEKTANKLLAKISTKTDSEILKLKLKMSLESE